MGDGCLLSFHGESNPDAALADCVGGDWLHLHVAGDVLAISGMGGKMMPDSPLYLDMKVETQRVLVPGRGEVVVDGRTLPVQHGWHVFAFFGCEDGELRLGSGPKIPLGAIPLHRFELSWWARLKQRVRMMLEKIRCTTG